MAEQYISMNNVTEINSLVNAKSESKRDMMNRIAREYYNAGLNVLPLEKGEKCPNKNIKWKKWKTVLMLPDEHEFFFSQYDASHGIGVITGLGSGGLEAIDIDTKNDPRESRFIEFGNNIKSLPCFQKLVKQKTVNNGRHLLYRCPNPLGNKQLAFAEGVKSPAIETRGQGGFLVVCPTDGYQLTDGSPGMVDIPTISDTERDELHNIARLCCKKEMEKGGKNHPKVDKSGSSNKIVPTEPEKDVFGYPSGFNQRKKPKEYLIKAGWTLVSSNGTKEHYRRPGKVDQGVSANWDDECKVFFVHTTGSSLPEGALSSFQVFAHLEHNSNFDLAAQYAKEIVSEELDTPLLITGKDLPKTKAELDANKPDEIIPGLCNKGGKITIGGAAKASKSFMVGNFIMSAVTGTFFLGKKIPRQKVLLIDLEVDFWELSRRFFGLAQKDSNGVAQYSEDLFILSLRKRPDLLDRTKLLQLVEKLKEEHDFDLIVLDCAYQIMGGLDENANAQMTELGRFFSALQKDETTLVVVHHFGKGDSYTKNVWDRFRGASSFGALFDACIVLAAHEKEDHLIAEFGARSFKGDPPMVLKFNPFPKLEVAEGEDPRRYRRAGQMAIEDDPVIKMIYENPNLGTKQLAEEFGYSQETIRKRAEKAGLKSVKSGGSTSWGVEENGQILFLANKSGKSL